MAISPLLENIHELERPLPAASQLAVLKNLKNELIGHPARKRLAVEHGLVDALVHVLSGLIKSRGKKRTTTDTNGTTPASPRPSGSDEDETLLQAVILVGALVNGGPAFVAPLLASSILQLLVEALRPAKPSRLRVTTLKTLLRLVEAARYQRPCEASFLSADKITALFSRAAVQAYCEILSQKATSHVIQQEVSFTAQFIRLICPAESHRTALVAWGVLDILASKLTAYCVHQRFWGHTQATMLATLPSPPSKDTLPHILGAITAILGDSRYRAARLLYSPLAALFFPPQKSDAREPTSPFDRGQYSTNQSSLIDASLPRTPASTSKEEPFFPKTLPSLGSLQPPEKGSPFVEIADTSRPVAEKVAPAPEADNSLVAWLVYTMRDEQGLTRMYAAQLIALLLRAGFVSKGRERMLALLVVPLLTRMVDEHEPSVSTSNDAIDSTEDALVENVPAVLASLVKESALLQKAATDAGVVERSCKMLKKTFQPFEPRRAPWSPSSGFEDLHDSQSDNPTRRLGNSGLPASIVARLKCRESNLVLIAAVADKDDKYRKMLKEQQIIPFLIDSLTPLDRDLLVGLLDGTAAEPVKATDLGNPEPVLIPACGAIRAFSRSVSILRTSLIDAGTAKPILALLTHTNVDVIVAATDVICNLLVEFSPMREELQEAGVTKILCEHAHSADSRIRLGSLWALKHLVQTNTNPTKLSCFEELGTGWLVQIISGGFPGGTTAKPTVTRLMSQVTSLGANNAAGERVNILNASDEPMDTSPSLPADLRTDTDDPMDADLEPLTPLAASANLPPETLARHAARLADIRSAEHTHANTAAQRDNLDIQVQGLDFIRNLMLGAGAPEMIDNIFATLGSTRVFQILHEKLAPPAAALAPPPAPRTAAALTRSALFIVNHIAGGTAKHRTLLTSQHALLRALVPHFSHPEPSVRVVCVWTVISLTWVDDEADAAGARQRAFELRGLGFEERLRSLQADESLDVRERVSTALLQMAELLDGGGGSAGSGAAAAGRAR